MKRETLDPEHSGFHPLQDRAHVAIPAIQSSSHGAGHSVYLFLIPFIYMDQSMVGIPQYLCTLYYISSCSLGWYLWYTVFILHVICIIYVQWCIGMAEFYDSYTIDCSSGKIAYNDCHIHVIYMLYTCVLYCSCN